MNDKPLVSFPTIITSDLIAPGAVLARHLFPYKSVKGDIYYNNDGSRLNSLPIGTTGQVLMVINGIPSWQTYPPVGTSRPTSGRFSGDQYFDTGTGVLSIWTGAAWLSTTLS